MVVNAILPSMATGHIDWDLPDPHGQPIEQVREIRNEIARRVHELIADLDCASETCDPIVVSHPQLDHVHIAAPPGCEVAARLSAAGVRVDWDDQLPGVRRFFSRDPWGNRLEFLAAS